MKFIEESSLANFVSPGSMAVSIMKVEAWLLWIINITTIAESRMG